MSPAWATFSSCSTTTNGVALPATSTLNGCNSVDLQFSNVSNSLGQSNTTARYWTTSPVINTVPTPDTISTGTLFMNGCTGTATDGNCATGNDWVSSGTGANTETGTVSFLVGNNGTNAPSESAYHWVINALAFTPNWTGLGVGDTASAVITFCVNATSTTATVGGCTVADRGQFTLTWNGTTTPTIGTTSGLGTLATVNGQGATLTLSTSTAIYNSLAMSTAFTLNAANGGSETLNNFGWGFSQTAETPEPSTFLLLSGALLGLGALPRKRLRA